jgi:hypothetical protein
MKILFRSIVVVFLFSILLVIGLSIAGLIMEDRLVSLSISQINKHLNAKVNVQHVDVSLLKSFPYASVVLHNVDIKEGSLNTQPEFEPGLLSFEEVILKIGIWGIVNNEYLIDQLILKNGWINLYFDNFGKGNFEIFSSSSSSTSNWLLDLNALRLDNVNLSYIDLRTGWVMKGLVDEGFIKGEFASHQQSLVLNSKIKIGLIKQGAFHYFRNQSVYLSTNLRISDDHVQFEKGFVEMGSSTFKLAGFIGRSSGSPISLNITGKNIDSEQLLSFLTQYNMSLHPKVKSKGKIAFDFSIAGYNKVDFPFTFNLNFNSDRFEIIIPNKPQIVVTKLAGFFTNGSLGKAESSELSLSFKEIRMLDTHISGSLKVKNIFSPLFHVKLNTSLNLSNLEQWNIQSPFIKGLISGPFEALGRLNRIDDIQFSQFFNTKVHTTLNFKGLTTSNINGLIFEKVDGNLSLAKNNLVIPNARGSVNGSLFEGSAEISNANAILFSRGQSKVRGNVALSLLDIKWFWDETSIEPQPESTTKSPWDNIGIVNVDVSANELRYGDIFCSSASFNVTVLDNSISVNQFTGNGFKGSIKGNLSVNNTSGSNYQVMSSIDMLNVEVSDLFRSFKNFDQGVVKSENISGSLSGSGVMKAIFSDGEIQDESLESSLNLKIEKGRLRDIEQLKGLSRFISLEDLMDIRFETMENTIRIENKTVTVPKMDIMSSALNLSISGLHHFNGNYQYRTELMMSDFLFGKAATNKPENNDFGDIVDDENGKQMKLFLLITGDTLDYKVSYDRESARQSFVLGLKNEGKNIREILSEEFKTFKRTEKKKLTEIDSLQALKPDSAEKSKEKVQKFTIEWEDE